MLLKQHLFFILFIIFSSCTYFNKPPEKEANTVARVHDKYLYKADLNNLVPAGASMQDSILIVKNFIDDWIKKNVILHKAEQNLGDEKKNVDRELEEYRNTLITFIYEKELVRQRLDTSVTNPEIEKYYYEHQKNFVLKNNIVKALFIKTSRNAPKLEKVKRWIQSSAARDFRELEAFAHQYAIDYYLDDNTWLLFDELLKKIPIKTYDKEEFLKNNRFIETNDSINIYLAVIKDFQVKESISPLSFEKENIRALIINKRKHELVEHMQQAAYDNALKNNEFEIYK